MGIVQDCVMQFNMMYQHAELEPAMGSGRIVSINSENNVDTVLQVPVQHFDTTG